MAEPSDEGTKRECDDYLDGSCDIHACRDLSADWISRGGTTPGGLAIDDVIACTTSAMASVILCCTWALEDRW